MRFCVSVTATALFLILQPAFAESGATNRPRRPSFLDRAWLRDPRPPVYQPPTASLEQLLAELHEIQARTLSILRRAEFSGDLPTALAAAWQARANIEFMSEFHTQLRASKEFESNSPIQALAFKDGSIRAVRAYWIQGESLHLITMEGAKETVPANLLDRDLTMKLDRSRAPSGF